MTVDKVSWYEISLQQSSNKLNGIDLSELENKSTSSHGEQCQMLYILPTQVSSMLLLFYVSVSVSLLRVAHCCIHSCTA